MKNEMKLKIEMIEDLDEFQKLRGEKDPIIEDKINELKNEIDEINVGDKIFYVEQLKTHYLDDVDFSIVKDEFKIVSLMEKMNLKKLNDLTELTLNELNPIINNKNLIVTSLPICKYNGKTYSIEDKLDIEELTELIKTKEVLIYLPEMGDNKILYRVCVVN